MRLRVRLRHVAEVSFRKSEATNFRELKAEVRDVLKGNDAVCFISKSRNQVQFVWGEDSIKSGRHVVPVISSAKLRLPKRGEFSGLMLGNYAQKVGLEIEGLKLFQQHYKQIAEAAQP